MEEEEEKYKMTPTTCDIGIMNENGGFLYWENESRCNACGERMLGEAHAGFIFVSHPDDLDVPWTQCGYPGKTEWRPDPDSPDILGDGGPNRVAYYLHGKPNIQVHEGPNANWMWTPCAAYRVILDKGHYWLWVCRRHIEDPCDTEYLRSIST